MPKICIVATYFDRQFQLNKTLDSISKSSHKDFEVIIVDDGSDEKIVLPRLDFKCTVIRFEKHGWRDSGIAFNTGFIKALKSNPEIVIIQNAECYHVGDVLGYAEKNLTNDNYISFSCYSLNQETTFSNHNIQDIINLNNRGALENGENAWYNHPVFRPVGYHFCTAIKTNNLVKINGFDERFSLGIGYDDNYLLHRIINLGLKIDITETPFVVHQWHYTTPEETNKAELIKRNSDLLQTLVPLNEIRAQHIYTPDLKG